jgi:methylated-DNA-protein-cysteine methyltransferase related protein
MLGDGVVSGPGPATVISPGRSRKERRRMSTLARLRLVIAKVPRGKVITYGQVAAAGGFPGAARLTVWALHRFEGLPWHRVVAAGGRIALGGDDGREQRLRLKIEGVKFRGDRVRMDLHNWTPNQPARRHRPTRAEGLVSSPPRSPFRKSLVEARQQANVGRAVR